MANESDDVKEAKPPNPSPDSASLLKRLAGASVTKAGYVSESVMMILGHELASVVCQQTSRKSIVKLPKSRRDPSSTRYFLLPSEEELHTNEFTPCRYV
jgi:hypothetical protein